MTGAVSGVSSTTEFPTYATHFSRSAQAVRREIPHDSLRALLEVIDELAQDPNRYALRTRPLSRDGKIFLYTHSQPALEITYEVDEERKIIYFLHFAAPVLQSAKPLFVCYSHDDAEWLVELRKWLRPLEQRQLIKIWDDTEISAGAEWEKEIEKSLAAAKVALLLVSDSFISSEFITTRELPRLLQAASDGGVVILWIAVRKIKSMDPAISKFQALYDPEVPLDDLGEAERPKALQEIFDEVKRVLDR